MRFLFSFILVIGFGSCKKKQEVADHFWHNHHVGYINKEKAIQYYADFEYCSKDIPIGFYSSAAPKIYNGGKYQFKTYILSNYSNNNYKTNGYLNFRFHINCKKEIGTIEINPLTNDFDKALFPQEMIDQLLKLIAFKDNWSMFYKEDVTYYMYLNFKIEDGNIIEIIP